MRFNIVLTWSKVMALLILALAGYLDISNNGNGSFMYSVPFVVALITGKQGIEYLKTKKEK